jgi:hypothetical protein
MDDFVRASFRLDAQSRWEVFCILYPGRRTAHAHQLNQLQQQVFNNFAASSTSSFPDMNMTNWTSP